MMKRDTIIQETVFNDGGESLALIELIEGGYTLALLPEEEFLVVTYDTLEEAQKWFEEWLDLYKIASGPISSITNAKVLANA